MLHLDNAMPPSPHIAAIRDAPADTKSNAMNHLLEDSEKLLSNGSSSSSSSGCSSGSITDEDATDRISEPSTDMSDLEESVSPIKISTGRSNATKDSSSPTIKSKRALDAKIDSDESNDSHIITSAQSTHVAKMNLEYNTMGDRTVWRNVIIFIILHIFAFQGFYRIYSKQLWGAMIFNWAYASVGGFGITAGAHRLWSHKAYKAKLPLRIFLMLCDCIAGQNDLYEWVRDHRVHHKFTETDADPHNAHRGYFFSHIGWLMTRKHPEVLRKGKQIDMSDILADPVIRFQMRYYLWLYFIFCFAIPTYGTWYLFPNVTIYEAFIIGGLYRYCASLHCTWFVNSAAHMLGDQPYNPYIAARENLFVAYGAYGEGFHNYHHSFPFDYRTSEMGWKLNPSAMFIDFMAKIGQAYDLRSVKPHMVKHRKEKVAAGTIKNTHDHCAYA